MDQGGKEPYPPWRRLRLGADIGPAAPYSVPQTADRWDPWFLPMADDVTTLLQRWGDGDAAALDRLVGLLYADLHARSLSSCR